MLSFPNDDSLVNDSELTDEVVFPGITTAFTGLRPAEARKTENPPAATPVQRFVRRFVFTARRTEAPRTTIHQRIDRVAQARLA